MNFRSALKARSELVHRWAEALSQKLGRQATEIAQMGLGANDFRSASDVSVVFNDGSHANFKYAFFVVSPDRTMYAVFTEHCGYFEGYASGVTLTSESGESFTG